jgi:phosphatidylserine decarboxylase
MLWTILDKLQVSMLASSFKENFYKHIKGMKLEVKKDRWKIKVEYSTLEKLTSNMKPPHCRTQKCQKPSQLLNLWMATSLVAPNEYHQDRMVAYWKLTSPKDIVFFNL